MMTDEMGKQVLDAYKTSPLLTGILLLNVLTIMGFGYYLLKKDYAVGEYVKLVRADQKELENKLFDLATKCGTKP